MEAHRQGYETYIAFVVQMKGVKYFTPHDETDPVFGRTLREAEKMGVKPIAFDCRVTENEISIEDSVEIIL